LDEIGCKIENGKYSSKNLSDEKRCPESLGKSVRNGTPIIFK